MEIVEKEYERDTKLKKKDVQLLSEWLKTQPHLPNMTEQEIIWALKSCYYSNEAAKTTIDNYFTMRTLCPEVFKERDLTSDKIKIQLNTMVCSVLPTKTVQNHTVLIYHLMDFNADNFYFPESANLFDMLVTADFLKNGTHEGFRIFCDMQGVSFSHVTRLNLIVVRKFLYYLQDGMLIRLKGLHFFNVNAATHRLISIIKPFLNKEVVEMLFTHKSISELEEFLPLEALPSDLGGNHDSYPVLHDRWKKNLQDCSDFFAYQGKQIVDESKRPGKPKNESEMFGIDGTFKKLELD